MDFWEQVKSCQSGFIRNEEAIFIFSNPICLMRQVQHYFKFMCNRVNGVGRERDIILSFGLHQRIVAYPI